MSRVARDLAASAHHRQRPLNENTHSNSTSTMQSLKAATGRAPKIAIIGAGVAGLRCADVLLANGANVTILEARNRVGGRLHQQESGHHLMDMGPNWIHGTTGNPIMKLAEKTKTVVVEPEEADLVFDSEGKRRTAEESEDLSAKTWELIGKAFRYSDENSPRIDPETSLYDYFKQQVSEQFKSPSKRQDLLHEARMWGPFIGESVTRQSLRFAFLEEVIDGENVFVASTYKSILEQISESALKSDIVTFDTEITQITQSSGAINLTTVSSQKHTFDEVILTTPLGWLKQNLISAFSPPLPPPLRDAIQNISYGRLEKLYITFPTAWWLTDSDISSYPLFTHFHSPTSYHPLHPPNNPNWNQSVLSLAHLPPPHNHPTLLFYIYGDCGAFVVNSIADLQPHSDAYNDALVKFGEPFYRLLPHYDPNADNCKPTNLLMTTWQADHLAGNGSYSNFQVGATNLDHDIVTLREAKETTFEDDPNRAGLWFAGEHVAPFVGLGTTTGAYWSGEAIAKRVLAKHGWEEVMDKDGQHIDSSKEAIPAGTVRGPKSAL